MGGGRCCGFTKVEGRWGLGDRGLGVAWERAVGGFGRCCWGFGGGVVGFSVGKVVKRKRKVSWWGGEDYDPRVGGFATCYTIQNLLVGRADQSRCVETI